MEHAHIVYSRTLATIVVLVAVTAVCAGSSAISLDVSSRVDSSCRRVGLVLTCIIHTDAGIDKVTSLAVFGTRPDANKPGLQQIAILDNSPKVKAEDLQQADISVYGDLGSNPYLLLLWPSYKFSTRHVYKCVATGNGSDGQAISISSTAQIEAVDANCEMYKAQAKLTGLTKYIRRFFNLTEMVASQTLHLSTRINEMELKCTTLDGRITHFHSLGNNFKNLETKYSDFIRKDFPHMQRLEAKVERVHEKFSSLKENIIRQLFMFADGINDEFDESRIHQGRVYILTKKRKQFNIAKANKYCRKFGGYLVEIDGKDEMKFVQNLLLPTDKWSHFFTGVNDIDKEGKFVFYHSKKPVPKLKWASGQPDSYGDCVEINGGFLNDLPCDIARRVICEVPI
ncbi:hypothetical protein RRG08_019413 [Elysia crispata]|uniref:C-type lectin domain-containing protein n=1 Tax=Elysia crispata TaxID=231223 RepID=A0AAE1D049_9GAST|nr:hypothetical protein RRG08_019413 [Elysia crispata]